MTYCSGALRMQDRCSFEVASPPPMSVVGAWGALPYASFGAHVPKVVRKKIMEWA